MENHIGEPGNFDDPCNFPHKTRDYEDITFRKMVKLTGFVTLPVTIFGLFGNSQLLYTTWKFKQLQHRNGILVGLIALFDLICELIVLKITIEALIGITLMPRNTCFNSIFLCSFSFNMACIVILFLAIDRLIAIWLPMR
ncbi:unnamed protein product [Gongylonema pulchrum]|uniref:G_PROTEIN_RECEP_F1_2 domain-containing protein n=1 Tax=Gongylonema pulchrum TaxID=637853 RepID=A0A183E0Q8_9BILA|nr:unnamed protein product [Gongylonema pulchrum]